MKWLGILCLFCTCTGVGLYASHQLRTRLVHTQLLEALLDDFSTHIRYQCLPLEDLLSMFAQHKNYAAFSFLGQAEREFSTCVPVQEIWCDAVMSDAAVTPRAADILCALGNVLGTTDMQGQLAALELYRHQMRELADEQKESVHKRGELYRRLGVLAGAMLAVLLV